MDLQSKKPLNTEMQNVPIGEQIGTHNLKPVHHVKGRGKKVKERTEEEVEERRQRLRNRLKKRQIMC